MSTNHTKKLQKIIDTGDLGLLEAYKAPKSWKSLDINEKNVLAMLFDKQGEELLNRNETAAFESLELARTISDNHFKVLYHQAMLLAKRQDDAHCLNLASTLCQTITEKEPAFYDGWCLWAYTLVRLGLYYREASYFQDANNKFIETERIMRAQNETMFAENYWQWGVCWYALGRFSGEALDFRSAIEKYQKAAALGLSDPIFWNDYGNALTEMAGLIGRQEIYLEAADCYNKTVTQNPKDFDGWLNLACIYQRLFSMSNLEEYHQLAESSFQKGADLQSEDGMLWLRWAQLNTMAGKMNHDPARFCVAAQQYEKAHQLEPDQPHILLGWGEALLLRGTYLEDLTLLRQAEEKLFSATELLSDNTEVWYLYGSCLNELGRYFGDEQYYLQAIEKFHYGLSLDRSDPLLWYGLAMAHYAIGDHRHDAGMIEKSARYCTRVIEFGGHGFPQFWNDWGVSLMKLGEMTNNKAHVEAALEKFDHALRQFHEDPKSNIIETEWLYNYGCALDFLGDFTEDAVYYEKAIQVLEQVLQIDPNYSHARYNVALALCHLGELTADIDCFHKSIEHFQVLLSQDSEDEMGWNDWGITLLNLAQLIHDLARPDDSQKIYEMAEDKLLHAIALGATSAFYNLACVYSLTGNFSSAMHYLERAKEANALPPIDDVMHDEWLDALRKTGAFRSFITQLTNNS